MNKTEAIPPVAMDPGLIHQPPQKQPGQNYLPVKNHAPPDREMPAGSGIGPATTVVISHAAQFYSELQLLQAQRPDQYNEVVSGIIDRLTAAARDAAEAESHLLYHLAERLRRAADEQFAARQPHTTFSQRQVAAVYGPHNPALSEVFPSPAASAFQPPLSANTEQTLNKIYTDVHLALFGASLPEEA